MWLVIVRVVVVVARVGVLGSAGVVVVLAACALCAGVEGGCGLGTACDVLPSLQATR